MKEKKRYHKARIIHKARKETCSNKKRYNNQTNAIAIALTMIENGAEDPLFYYKCDLCNGYHITKRGGGTSIAI